jgi:hypothetical protein
VSKRLGSPYRSGRAGCWPPPETNAYVYFEEEPGTAHLLTRDEATPGSRENRFTRGPPAVDESLTGVTL